MIIGITGTMGAGKGAVVDYLMQKHDYGHASARTFLTAEVKRRGMPVVRESMRFVADDFRKNYQPTNGYIMLGLLKEAEELIAGSGPDGKKHPGAVIESIRTIPEIETLRAARADDFIFWAVDANQQMRYERIVKRGSETDNVTFEEFVAAEERESITGEKEPWRGNLPGCIAAADITVKNEGTLEELHAAIEKALQQSEQIIASRSKM